MTEGTGIHPRWAKDHAGMVADTNRHPRMRAALAASFIPAGSRVLDLGCGAMPLREHLPEGCSYTPSDIWKRHPDIVPADLNKGEFPDGEWDVIAMLGVAAYLETPSLVLRTARERAPMLILSTSLWPILTHRSVRHAEARGQVNFWRLPDLTSLLRRSGWTIEKRTAVRRPRSWLMQESMFVCK